MRALFVFGSIALYIACAFVQPSQANLRSFAERAMRLHALHSSSLVAAGRNASVTTLVDTATNVVKTATATRPLRHAANLIPTPAAVVSTVSNAIVGAGNHASSLSVFVNAETNQALRTQFERIQWAVMKSDPRLCNVLSESNMGSIDNGSPTFGDLLAFCLAETTRESGRCDQIDPVTASALHEACVKELAVRS